MRICGVICEYNPFHNGHAYHLAQARARTEADYLICVMSGSFTQRGEPALADKWSRAHMALLCGADLVVELPALFAVRPAEQFAYGGVSLLHALGAHSLAFGSESTDLEALQATAALLEEESEDFQESLRIKLAQGATHARARSNALAEVLPAAAHEALAQPNGALAVCYLRALAQLGSDITPALVPRAGSGYHDLTAGPMASATAVRAAIEADRWTAVEEATPPEVYEALHTANSMGSLQKRDALDVALLAKLRNMPSTDIAALCDVSEGLEHRIQRAAWRAGTREQLLTAIKCKRYTRSRLSRILCAALLDLTRELAERYPTPPYARVLGFRRDAQPLLTHLKRAASVPLITKVATSGFGENSCFALDLHATDLWSLGCASPLARAAGRDFVTSPIIVP